MILQNPINSFKNEWVELKKKKTLWDFICDDDYYYYYYYYWYKIHIREIVAFGKNLFYGLSIKILLSF